MSKVAWAMFDGSGISIYEYAKAGWKCFCFNADSADHGEYIVKMKHENITYVNCWIDKDFLVNTIDKNGIPAPDIIFAFPSCTNLSGSGAKHTRTTTDMMESVNNAKLVERLGIRFNCPWLVENPVGKMSTLWRKPNFYFDPYEYGGYLSDKDGSFHPKMPLRDGYTKKTCIWYGNGFVIPEKRPVPHIGCFWGWKSLGGKSEKTKQLRSLTPRGFFRAIFKFNK